MVAEAGLPYQEILHTLYSMPLLLMGCRTNTNKNEKDKASKLIFTLLDTPERDV